MGNNCTWLQSLVCSVYMYHVSSTAATVAPPITRHVKHYAASTRVIFVAAGVVAVVVVLLLVAALVMVRRCRRPRYADLPPVKKRVVVMRPNELYAGSGGYKDQLNNGLLFNPLIPQVATGFE